MTTDELQRILADHAAWRNWTGGSRANLACAYLARANLAGADLTDANLACAYLARAYLACAYLARANLADANLAGADLTDANLACAYLARANLARANLAGANLAGADLAGANLAGADLAGANLAGANLAGADLAGAKISASTRWPAPSVILLARWHAVSVGLCRRLMAYDAANHPHPEKFTAWARDGACPYTGERVCRCANFSERRELWSDDLLVLRESALTLAQDLIREKCVFVADKVTP